MRPVRLLPVFGLLSLTACGGAAGPTATPSPTVVPTFPPGVIGASCEPQEGGDQGAAMLLTAVRVDAQPGFDRVALEFRPRTGQEASVPFWRVEQVEAPLTEDPTGDELDVPGQAFLRAVIWASGVEFTEDGFEEIYTGPDRFDPQDTAVIAQVRQGGDFENTMTWYAGLEHEACFKVTELPDPVRIVLDVEAPEAE